MDMPVIQKAAKKKTRPLVSVATLAEIAHIYAVSGQTVKQWRADGMPGKPGKYVLNTVSNWLRTDGPWKPYTRASAAASTTEDPLLADGDSPALERYRLAKAKHAELDLEQRKGDLIDKEKCRDVLGRWGAIIRKMGDRVSKRFGTEANQMIRESLDECESIVRGLQDADS